MTRNEKDLLDALKTLLHFEGTTVDTGIGPMEPDELVAARRTAQEVIERVEQPAVTRMYAKVTSQGQISVPKLVREASGLMTGDHLEFYEEEGKWFARLPVKGPNHER